MVSNYSKLPNYDGINEGYPSNGLPRIWNFSTIDNEILRDLDQKAPRESLSDAQLQYWNMLAWAHYRDNFEPPIEFVLVPDKTCFNFWAATKAGKLIKPAFAPQLSISSAGLRIR